MPDWMTTSEVAFFLKMSKRSVHRLWRAGQLPEPRRIGKRAIRWHKQELIDWLESYCPPLVEVPAAELSIGNRQLPAEPQPESVTN
jgi:excisionase family DNA binding protein